MAESAGPSAKARARKGIPVLARECAMDLPRLPSFTVQMDPETIVSMITLWRDAVDLRMPIARDLQPHFLERRKHMLYNFEMQAKAWRQLLQGCSAEGSNVAGLDQLRRHVDDFWEWAEEGLMELARVAIELSESTRDPQFLTDPLLEAHIRKARKGPAAEQTP